MSKIEYEYKHPPGRPEQATYARRVRGDLTVCDTLAQAVLLRDHLAGSLAAYREILEAEEKAALWTSECHGANPAEVDLLKIEHRRAAEKRVSRQAASVRDLERKLRHYEREVERLQALGGIDPEAPPEGIEKHKA